MAPITLILLWVALVVLETDQAQPTFVIKRNDQPQAVEIASEDAHLIRFHPTKLNLITPTQILNMKVNPLIENLTKFLSDNTDGIILEPTSLTLVTTYANALIDINDKLNTLKPDCYFQRSKRSTFRNAIISLLNKLGQELMGKALSKRTALTSLMNLITKPMHLLTPQDKQGPPHIRSKVNSLFRDIILTATSVANRLLDELDDVKATLREVKTPRMLRSITGNSSMLATGVETLVAQPQTPWLRNFITLKREGCVTTVSIPEAKPERIKVKNTVLVPSAFCRFVAPRTTYMHEGRELSCVNADGEDGALVCTPVSHKAYLAPGRSNNYPNHVDVREPTWPKDHPTTIPVSTTSDDSTQETSANHFAFVLTIVDTMLTIGIIVTIIVLVIRVHLYNRRRSSRDT